MKKKPGDAPSATLNIRLYILKSRSLPSMPSPPPLPPSHQNRREKRNKCLLLLAFK